MLNIHKLENHLEIDNWRFIQRLYFHRHFYVLNKNVFEGLKLSLVGMDLLKVILTNLHSQQGERIHFYLF